MSSSKKIIDVISQLREDGKPHISLEYFPPRSVEGITVSACASFSAKTVQYSTVLTNWTVHDAQFESLRRALIDLFGFAIDSPMHSSFLSIHIYISTERQRTHDTHERHCASRLF